MRVLQTGLNPATLPFMTIFFDCDIFARYRTSKVNWRKLAVELSLRLSLNPADYQFDSFRLKRIN